MHNTNAWTVHWGMVVPLPLRSRSGEAAGIEGEEGFKPRNFALLMPMVRLLPCINGLHGRDHDFSLSLPLFPCT